MFWAAEARPDCGRDEISPRARGATRECYCVLFCPSNRSRLSPNRSSKRHFDSRYFSEERKKKIAELRHGGKRDLDARFRERREYYVESQRRSTTGHVRHVARSSDVCDLRVACDTRDPVAMTPTSGAYARLVEKRWN